MLSSAWRRAGREPRGLSSNSFPPSFASFLEALLLLTSLLLFLGREAEAEPRRRRRRQHQDQDERRPCRRQAMEARRPPSALHCHVAATAALVVGAPAQLSPAWPLGRPRCSALLCPQPAPSFLPSLRLAWRGQAAAAQPRLSPSFLWRLLSFSSTRRTGVSHSTSEAAGRPPVIALRCAALPSAVQDFDRRPLYKVAFFHPGSSAPEPAGAFPSLAFPTRRTSTCCHQANPN